MNYRKSLKLKVAAISEAPKESTIRLLRGRSYKTVYRIGLERLTSESENHYFGFLQDTFSILSLEHPKIGDIFIIQISSEDKSESVQ